MCGDHGDGCSCLLLEKCFGRGIDSLGMCPDNWMFHVEMNVIFKMKSGLYESTFVSQICIPHYPGEPGNRIFRMFYTKLEKLLASEYFRGFPEVVRLIR